jgi:hypothetical protein
MGPAPVASNRAQGAAMSDLGCLVLILVLFAATTGLGRLIDGLREER